MNTTERSRIAATWLRYFDGIADSAIWVSPSSARLLPDSRRIYLARGDYDWNHKWVEEVPAGVTQRTYRIFLAAGWYYWNCAVYTKTDVELFDYFARCSLTQEGAGTAYSPEMQIAAHDQSFAKIGLSLVDGSWYNWSSTLTQV